MEKTVQKRRLRQVRPAWEAPAATGRNHDAAGSWCTAGLLVRGRPDGLHAYDVETGKPRWSWIAPGRRALIAMSRTAADGVGLALHTAEDDGQWPERHEVTAVDLTDGSALWSAPHSMYHDPWSRGTDTLAVAGDRAVALAKGVPTARSLRGGNIAWPRVPPLRGDGRLAVCRTGVVQTALDAGRLTVRCLDAAEGSVRWTVRPRLEGPVERTVVLHQDPLALLCLGGGRRSPERSVLVLSAEDGRTTARIPVDGPHGELLFPSDYGFPEDQPVTAVQDVVVMEARPPHAHHDHLTAFAVDGGTPRWTWESRGTITGVTRWGDHVLAVSKLENSEGPDGTVHVHLLRGATGTVEAVRRLYGYQAGMSGRYHIDEDGRLVRVSGWGGQNWHPAQMFRLW